MQQKHLEEKRPDLGRTCLLGAAAAASSSFAGTATPPSSATTKVCVQRNEPA